MPETAKADKLGSANFARLLQHLACGIRQVRRSQSRRKFICAADRIQRSICCNDLCGRIDGGKFRMIGRLYSASTLSFEESSKDQRGID